MLFSLFAGTAIGQESDITIYSRPEAKVYKSLSAALANPDSVYILELKGKKLSEIPEGVFKLHNLEVLDLGRNRIRKINPQIANMIHLQELDLSSNKLDEFPEGITALKGLQKLSLNRNEIVTIPPSIGKMESLQVLEMWDNEIETLPDEIAMLKNLRYLELRGILFSEDQQREFHELLPETTIMMSPSCNCKTQ